MLNVMLFILIIKNRPEYLRDYQLNINPDSLDYVLLGRNVFLLKEYSRSSEAPYVSDVFRTPAYPLFSGALDIVGGGALIYLTQVLLQSLNCVIIFLLTQKLFGKTAALIASLLCATDVMLAVLNFEALSEAVYVPLISISALVLIPQALAQERSRHTSFFLGGMLIGIATYVRPAGPYLPLVYAIATLVVGLWGIGWKKALINSVTVPLGAVILLAPWIVRNQVVFGIPHLTTNDTIVLVYYTGAGAYQVHHGVDQQTAQQMIAEEFGLRPPEEMWNYWKSDLSPKDMDDPARAAVPEILGKYPLDLARSSAIGIMKASISHNVNELGGVLGKTWTAPRLDRILRFDGSAIAALVENQTGLVAIFVWEVLHAACVIALACAGLFWGMCTRQRRMIGVVLLILQTFFVATVGAYGLEAYSRLRAPVMPLAYVTAGYALAMIFFAYRTRFPGT